MTTLHDFGSVLRQRPLNTFLLGSPISWPRLLALSDAPKTFSEQCHQLPNEVHTYLTTNHRYKSLHFNFISFHSISLHFTARKLEFAFDFVDDSCSNIVAGCLGHHLNSVLAGVGSLTNLLSFVAHQKQPL